MSNSNEMGMFCGGVETAKEERKENNKEVRLVFALVISSIVNEDE